jgi:hypothetical protein
VHAIQLATGGSCVTLVLVLAVRQGISIGSTVPRLDFQAINCEEDTGSWYKEAGSQEDKKMRLGVPRFAGIFEGIEGERGRKSGKGGVQMTRQCVNGIQ